MHRLTGQRFGRLVVVSRAGSTKRKDVRWLCQCDCGKTKFVSCPSLIEGRTQSCGCLRTEALLRRVRRHGEGGRGRRVAEYRVWYNMRTRCNNPSWPRFKDYGGRGVKVCERWNEYPNFLADMGRRPSLKHSLDRIDVDGDYSPENCRWATHAEQAANRRKVGVLANFTDAELLAECNKRGLTHATSEGGNGIRSVRSSSDSFSSRAIPRLRREHGARRRGGALPKLQSLPA